MPLDNSYCAASWRCKRIAGVRCSGAGVRGGVKERRGGGAMQERSSNDASQQQTKRATGGYNGRVNPSKNVDDQRETPKRRPRHVPPAAVLWLKHHIAPH